MSKQKTNTVEHRTYREHVPGELRGSAICTRCADRPVWPCQPVRQALPLLATDPEFRI